MCSRSTCAATRVHSGGVLCKVCPGHAGRCDGSAADARTFCRLRQAPESRLVSDLSCVATLVSRDKPGAMPQEAHCKKTSCTAAPGSATQPLESRACVRACVRVRVRVRVFGSVCVCTKGGGAWERAHRHLWVEICCPSEQRVQQRFADFHSGSPSSYRLSGIEHRMQARAKRENVCHPISAESPQLPI